MNAPFRSLWPILGAVLAAALVAPIAQASVTGADGIAIDEYDLVSSTRLSRTQYEYTYRAYVSNWSNADAAVTATLTSTPSNITVVQGSLDVGEVAQGASQLSVGTFVVRVDRTQPFDTEALAWTAQATPLPPTTFELIDTALAAGDIDAETALVYKVFSEFRDDRLPAQYVGRDDGSREATAIQDAIESYATLSAPTQAVLEPFMLPPENPASWYRLRAPAVSSQSARSAPAVSARAARKAAKRKRVRASALTVATAAGCAPLVDPSTGELVDGVVPTANGKVCVHYFAAFGDEATATALAGEINDKIWPSLTGLFREPILDANGLLQVYLVDNANMTQFYSGSGSALGIATICHGNVSHIFLNRDQTAELNQTAAHEMFHAISASYNRAAACGEALWLGEATATWVEHFVYPCVQSEHGYAPVFLNAPTASLEDTSGLHEYGAYLWFLYMTRVARGACAPGGGAGDPAYAARVWNALSFLDSLGAVDIAITEPNGLTKKWHDFVLDDWNRVQGARKPYASYWLADRLPHKARESQGPDPIQVDLGGAVAKVYRMPHVVRHLGAAYYHFDLTQDSTIRRIRLLHRYSSNTSGNVKVQAILKTDRGWQKAVDWTGFEEKTLCRDKADEKFQELVIVISNSEFDDRGFTLTDTSGDQTKLRVSALGCSNWKGSATGTFTSSAAFPDDVIHASTEARDVKLERLAEIWTDDADLLQFAVKGGTVNWKYDERSTLGGGLCTADFMGSYGLANLTPAEAFFAMGENEKPEYRFLGGTFGLSDEDYPMTCVPPLMEDIFAGVSGSSGVALWLATPLVPPLPSIYDSGGDLIAGQYVLVAREGSRAFSWAFTKDGTFTDP